MKKTELILYAIAVIALIFKLFHFPGSDILMIISLFFISVMYFIFGFALLNNLRFRELFKTDSFKRISTNQIIGGIGTGIALSIGLIGILFKIQGYPGADINLIGGMLTTSILSAIVIFKQLNKSTPYYLAILRRTLPVMVVCATLFIIPTETWLNWRYPNNPEYVQAILQAQNNPDSVELWKKVEKEEEKMLSESEED
jgi:hypothetical protein